MSNHHRDARRPRPVRPRCEALEGRALLAYYSAYDPTFGRLGAVVGAPDPGGGAELSVVSAVAVQPDGKVVAVGTRGSTPFRPFPVPQLAVRRYDADGSPDATFGDGGQVDLPLPGVVGILEAPHNVAIGADGTIAFAATASVPAASPTGQVAAGLAFRLTAAGRLDPTFGAGGVYRLPGLGATASAVALDAGGRLLVLGGAAGLDATNRMALTRLTPAGVPDATFHGTGTLPIPLPAAQAGPIGGANPTSRYDPVAVAVAPDGRIYAAGNHEVGSAAAASTTITAHANVVRVDPGGAIDATYGAGGTATVGDDLARLGFYPTLDDVAVGPDGNLVAVGFSSRISSGYGFIRRIRPDGAADPTFAANSTPDDVPADAGYRFGAVAVAPDGSVTVGATPDLTGPALVVRYTAAGLPDAGFGSRGRFLVAPTASPAAPGTGGSVADVAALPDGRVVVAGTLVTSNRDYSFSNAAFLARLRPVPVTILPGDYDGDGRSDVAALLTGPAVYAYRPTFDPGAGDVLRSFGAAGAGNSIPAPGDYDGDGKSDLAAYLPAQGKLFYRASSLGLHIEDSPNYGEPAHVDSIPAAGDYDGDGRTDPAVYDPAGGWFTFHSSATTFYDRTPIGAIGAGASIPAPGDYDGDGRTDFAVYLSRYAVLAYRPSTGGPDVLTSFGAPGDRASIPAPGDYDGDGRTDLAVYLPRHAVYAYRPSSGGPDVLTSFGVTGDGATIPAPGDYDGDGRYDLAAYIPRYALYAYRPSSAAVGGPDALATFGTVGTGATVPASSIPYAQPPTISGMGLAATAPAPAGVPVALTDDVQAILGAATGRRKKG